MVPTLVIGHNTLVDTKGGMSKLHGYFVGDCATAEWLHIEAAVSHFQTEGVPLCN